MLASALDLEGRAWDEHVYHPTMWNDDGTRGKKASDSQMDGVKQLRDMKRNPSELTAHFMSQPAFSARRIGSDVSESETSASTASSGGDMPHMVAAVKTIKNFTNDGLAQDGAKKPRLEPAATEEEMTAFVAAKKAAKLDKRRAAKKAKKSKEKADAEMDSREEEYNLASM